MAGTFGFGIEIEAVVEPWRVRPHWQNKPQEYYERLAQALRNRQLKAVADKLDSSWAPHHPEHYDKWFITRDGSLAGSGNQVCLEAVSPVLQAGTKKAEDEILLFWEAMRKVFKVQQNFTCGSHVHVAPFGKKYKVWQLKIIAFAIVSQEHLVHSLLPRQRQANNYCKLNSSVSPQLRQFFSGGKSGAAIKSVGDRIKTLQTGAQVWELMQGTEQSGRYVIWNFKNIVSGPAGTIEFRGGRHLRGPNRALWWVTFTVAFISLALRQKLLEDTTVQLYVPPSNSSEAYKTKMFRFWEDIKSEADRLGMGGHLPSNWKRMCETPGS